MRENPWHLRRPSTGHYLWLRNLLELHSLTLEWLKELNVERPAHFLSRGIDSRMAETLWQLEPLLELAPQAGATGRDLQSLDRLLDDTAPEDVLGRMERTLYAVQAWAYAALLERAPADSRSAVTTQLEQASWKAGRDLAQARWSNLDADSRSDARGFFAAYRDYPLAGRPDRTPFLVLRSTPQAVDLQLLACPHQLEYAEVLPFADPLCRLHAHWTRGFAYGISTKLTVEHLPGTSGQRCGFRFCRASDKSFGS